MEPIVIEEGFGDVPDYDIIPAGNYRAVVYKGEVRTAGEDAKHPKSQYIAWEFNILTEGYEKRKQWTNTSLVPEARGLLKRFLKGVGYTDEELNTQGFTLDIDEIVGRECMLSVRVTDSEQYGKQNKVQRVMPLGELSELAGDLP